MPIYEYKCDKCDLVFSELRKISERKAPIACPKCGGEAQVIVSMFAQSSGSSQDSNIGACNSGST